ncbi:hypothetical protein JHK85_023149 [Glycine max]|nr:hypothetical protein JHK85_023149 [Glycine max]
MFHNDMELVKKSPNSPIHDPLEETNSFKESVDFYMDKSVTECEAELLICHKETSYNIIKDTWVDEGYPTKDKIFIRTKVDEKIYKIYSWNCENKETVKDNIGINVLNPLAKEEPDQSKDLMQEDEDATRKLDDNVYKEIVVPEDKILLQKLDIKRSKTLGFEGDEIKQNHAKVASEPEFHSQSEKSKNEIEDAVDKEESSPVSDCNCGQTQNADLKSDDYGVTNQVHQRLCELSFSSIGYSGPLPFSGSISLRSDRSIDSTWSFARPILQPEFNNRGIAGSSGIGGSIFFAVNSERLFPIAI